MTMHAVVFHELGEPSVLKYEAVEKPDPDKSDVVVKVEAAGVNFSDAGKRRGLYLEPTPLPYIPGSEVAGTVVACGSGVSRFEVGDRIVGLIPSRSGGYAEYAVLPETCAVAVPDALSCELAVCLPNQGPTAEQILRRVGRLTAGETVLVSAATGGVGGLAVQLAKIYGAGRVIAAVGTAEKRADALALGADDAVSSDPEDWTNTGEAFDGGIDLVLDSVGGPFFDAAFPRLKPFGRLVCFGLASGQPNTIMPVSLIRPSTQVCGFHLDQVLQDGDTYTNVLQHLMDLVLDGRLKLRVGGRFTFAQAVSAHQLLESRTLRGKIVMSPVGA